MQTLATELDVRLKRHTCPHKDPDPLRQFVRGNNEQKCNYSFNNHCDRVNGSTDRRPRPPFLSDIKVGPGVARGRPFEIEASNTMGTSLGRALGA